MKQAIKALFEQAKNKITELNIDTTLLVAVMSELVRDYIAEGNLELAHEASKLTGNTADPRLVYEASRTVTPHTKKSGWDGERDIKRQEDLLFDILLSGGTDEELREAAVFLEEKTAFGKVIRIYTHLNDSAALARYGLKIAESYFALLAQDKKKIRSYDSGLILKSAFAALTAAKNLGARDLDAELIRFGDRLFALEDKFCALGCYDYSYHGHKEIEALCAYELASTKPALTKAGKEYLRIQYFDDAVRCFEKAGNADCALDLARNGRLLDAVKICAKLTESQIDGLELQRLIDAASETAKTLVVRRIGTYLNNHSDDKPFPTREAYDHGYIFSGPNDDEWRKYLREVHGMAGRTDCNGPSIAKELYSTSHAVVIGQIYLKLQKHLLTGYLLSAIAMEINGERLEDYPYDSAHQVFQVNVYGKSHRRFRDGLDFEGDPDVSALAKDVDEFHRQMVELADKNPDGWVPNSRSDEFLRNKLPELQVRVRGVYQKLTGDIRSLLTQLG